MKIFGIILIVIGILAFVVPVVSFTHEEKVLEVGPIKVMADKEESLPIPSLLGVSAIAVGAAMVVASVITKTP
jgi:hypothetical protein